MAKIVVVAGKADSLVLFRGHLLQEMVARGHEVIACAPGESAPVRDKLAEFGVRYVAIHLNRTGMNPLKDMVSVVRLTRLFRSMHPDIFLGYTIKPVIYGSLAARLAGIPNIHSMITGLGYAFSGTDLKSRTIGGAVRHLFRMVLKSNRIVFFQNPDDRDVFVNGGLLEERKSIVINGSGVNIDEYSPAPLPGRVTFVLIARLIRDKGIVEYVAAADELRKRYPDARFRLVGPYDSNPSAISEAEVKAWVDAGSIEYLGSLEDVRPALADASVFVLPTFYREGTPRTILEAMSMGRPIITTDAPGCRETVNSGENGYLIPKHQVPPLTEAMEKFLKEPDLITQMGAASREVAVEKYDVRKVTSAILDGMQLS